MTRKFAWSALLSRGAATCASVRRQQLVSMAVEYCTNTEPALFAGNHYEVITNPAKEQEADTGLAPHGQLEASASTAKSDFPPEGGLDKDEVIGKRTREILSPDGAPGNMRVRDIADEFGTVLDAKLQPVFDVFNVKLQNEAEGLRWPPETKEPG